MSKTRKVRLAFVWPRTTTRKELAFCSDTSLDDCSV